MDFNALIDIYRGVISLMKDGQVLNLNQRATPLYNDPGVDNKFNNYWFDGKKWQSGKSAIFKKEEPIIDIQDVLCKRFTF